MASSKVKSHGDLFKDPEMQRVDQLIAGAPRAAELKVQFNVAPLDDTLAAAEKLVLATSSEWEEDAEGFMKLLSS